MNRLYKLIDVRGGVQAPDIIVAFVYAEDEFHAEKKLEAAGYKFRRYDSVRLAKANEMVPVIY